MQRLKLPDDYLVRAYLVEKKSSNALAKEFNCSVSAISKRLKENGVIIRPPSEAFKGINSKEKNPNWGKSPSEETRRKQSIAHKGKSKSKEHREKISASNKGKPHPWMIGDKNVMNRPEVRDKVLAAVRSPEVRAKNSVANAGENNAQWRGGVSFKPYCQKFTEKLRDGIREDFGRKCYLCGISENGIKLDVHHCDYNKGQGCGARWSLLPLCHACHTKTGRNRWYWFGLLSNYWALNPKINFNLF